ncbi:MAG: glycosyltransferase [Deltaproteobacteria bacterium]|nr:glycosyltransferase [Deltaproteobacteria bacterium]
MERIIVNPNKIKKAEIVVGIPSYKEEDSIGFVISKVDEGLTKYFSRKDAVIINVDNNSPDNTKDVFLTSNTKTPKIYISTPPGVKGKGRNIRNLFEAGVELGAKAIVMVDADLKSITGEWIQYLAEPLYMGYDYVIPIYVRHKYDGTITNNITYPLTRVLYGLRTRQPIAGDFGFSGRLARAYLTEKSWSDVVSEFGIDIWMTTIAMARGFNVCQAFLGAPKAHRAKDPSAHLGPMFFQVVGTVFQLAVDFEFIWKELEESRPTSIFGFGLGVKENPPEVKVNVENLYKSFIEGEKKYGSFWQKVVAPINLEEILKIKEMKIPEVDVPADLWARILFDYIVAYRDEQKDRVELLNSLIPLYYIRTLSFVNHTTDMDTKAAEEYLEAECRIMEGEKYYLISKWNQTPRKDGLPSIAQYLGE